MISLLFCVFATACATPMAQAGEDQRTAQSERFDVYFGIVPDAKAQSSGERHPVALSADGSTLTLERELHHVTIAEFDRGTGARAVASRMTANHVAPHGASDEKVLQPMTIGGVTSYGNTFVVPEGRGHRFVVRIELDSRVDGVEFLYDNLHGDPR